jgi:hypothetical protein
MKVIDLTGQTFGFLTVLRRDGTKYSFAAWLVRCVCGTEKTLPGNAFRLGGTLSCGCKKTQLNRIRRQTHGMSGAPTHTSWLAMKSRCYRRTDRFFRLYGGRGIRVCRRWHRFENFLEDMGAKPSPKHSLDRIDNDGDYEPGNCRWATASEQANNRSNTVHLTVNGRTQSLAQWARESGLSAGTLKSRLWRGWSADRALSEPLRTTGGRPR